MKFRVLSSSGSATRSSRFILSRLPQLDGQSALTTNPTFALTPLLYTILIASSTRLQNGASNKATAPVAAQAARQRD
jgi:hypothetical protein